MQQHNTAIGIMDQAYFVPKKDILKWIHHCLKLQVDVIEDLGSGAVYCQLLDAAFGQRVPMQKVNWKAKFEYEFIANLKVFQTTLERLGITKKIDIQKLARTKYQDNLQMIQWLKRYIQISGSIGQGYNAEQRRSHQQLNPITQTKKALGTSFKTNTSFMSNSSSCVNLNQSICSAMSKTKLPLVRTRVIPNKQNHFNQNSKQTKRSSQASSLSQKMNEIKKVLMSSEDSDYKINEINKIVYGETHTTINNQNLNSSNLIDIEAVESDQQLVF